MIAFYYFILYNLYYYGYTRYAQAFYLFIYPIYYAESINIYRIFDVLQIKRNRLGSSHYSISLSDSGAKIDIINNRSIP